MRDCKKCQNDTFGVREKCHFLIQEESEKIFLIVVPKKEKNKANHIAKRENGGINY